MSEEKRTAPELLEAENNALSVQLLQLQQECIHVRSQRDQALRLVDRQTRRELEAEWGLE